MVQFWDHPCRPDRMGAWTVRLLRKMQPETRLHVAAWLFWISILLGVYCTIYVANGSFERVLMAISWLAVTLTAVDIVVSADIRSEVEN